MAMHSPFPPPARSRPAAPLGKGGTMDATVAATLALALLLALRVIDRMTQ